MESRFLAMAAVVASFLALPAVATAAGVLPVTGRAEGGSRTLVQEARPATLTEDTLVVKDNNPAHGCRGDSVAGALELATRGSWSGTFFTSFGDYFVKTI